MDKEILKKIHANIDNSTIPEEIKALYEMASATELMSVQVFERIRAIYTKNGYRCAENDLLKGINDYCKAVKTASFLFAQRIEPQIFNATYNLAGSKAYDWFNSDTNELCRLILLYIDRTARNNENYTKVFDFLQDLPTCGIFKEKDVEKYVMQGTQNE